MPPPLGAAFARPYAKLQTPCKKNVSRESRYGSSSDCSSLPYSSSSSSYYSSSSDDTIVQMHTKLRGMIDFIYLVTRQWIFTRLGMAGGGWRGVARRRGCSAYVSRPLPPTSCQAPGNYVERCSCGRRFSEAFGRGGVYSAV